MCRLNKGLLLSIQIWKLNAVVQVSQHSSVGRAIDCRVSTEINWSLVRFRLLRLFLAGQFTWVWRAIVVVVDSRDAGAC